MILLGFAIGLIVGVFFGVLLAGLCQMAGRDKIE